MCINKTDLETFKDYIEGILIASRDENPNISTAIVSLENKMSDGFGRIHKRLDGSDEKFDNHVDEYNKTVKKRDEFEAPFKAIANTGHWAGKFAEKVSKFLIAAGIIWASIYGVVLAFKKWILK